MAFCNSPYISNENYEDTLHELIGMFYDFKNDTWDAVTDDELIMFYEKRHLTGAVMAHWSCFQVRRCRNYPNISTVDVLLEHSSSIRRNSMTVLDVLHPILPEQLNSRYYFQSLMERAHLCGLLSDQELSKIQTELLIILAEQTDKWSQGKSSSIPMEKAQELLTSACFCDRSAVKVLSSTGKRGRGIESRTVEVSF